MTAEQALAYGMIDHIIEKRPAGAVAGKDDPTLVAVASGIDGAGGTANT
jgi:hypothetical protein